METENSFLALILALESFRNIHLAQKKVVFDKMLLFCACTHSSHNLTLRDFISLSVLSHKRLLNTCPKQLKKPDAVLHLMQLKKPSFNDVFTGRFDAWIWDWSCIIGTEVEVIF